VTRTGPDIFASPTAATTEGGVNALSAALGDLADEMATTIREVAAERR
jgi:hypothetical protein